MMSWRQAQSTLLKCMFSNHPSKRAVWFESSSQPGNYSRTSEEEIGDSQVSGGDAGGSRLNTTAAQTWKQAAEGFPDARLQPS